MSTAETARAIESAVTSMLFAIDRLDWSALHNMFSERVAVDYTSLFGGQAEDLTSRELIERWRSLLPGFDATQHMTGPVIVTSLSGLSATAETHVRGYHYVNAQPGGTWMVAGHYVMTLRQEGTDWRIASITLQAFKQEGDLNLPTVAINRVAAGVTRGSAS